MPRNPTRARHLSARRAFARLLNDHLKRGQHPDTRPDRWKPWTNNDFSGATDVSPNTVANWRNETAPTPPDDILPVLDALFAEKPDFKYHRKELKEAWEGAKGLLPPDEPESETDPTDDWTFDHRSRTTALAGITLHQPRRANPAGRYYLDASIIFAPLIQEDDDGRAVTIGLRDAILDIKTENCGHQIAQGTLIGRRAPHDHIKPAVDSITISGPAPSGHLDGDPIGDDHLAILEPGTPGENALTLLLTAGTRAFNFAYASAPNTPPQPTKESPNRETILNLLFGEALPRDPTSNRLLLARATMRRKPHS